MKKIGESTWYTLQPSGTFLHRGAHPNWSKTILEDIIKADTAIVKNAVLQSGSTYLIFNEIEKRALFVPVAYTELILAIEPALKERINIYLAKTTDTPTSLKLSDGAYYFEIKIIDSPKPPRNDI